MINLNNICYQQLFNNAMQRRYLFLILIFEYWTIIKLKNPLTFYSSNKTRHKSYKILSTEWGGAERASVRLAKTEFIIWRRGRLVILSHNDAVQCSATRETAESRWKSHRVSSRHWTKPEHQSPNILLLLRAPPSLRDCRRILLPSRNYCFGAWEWYLIL